MTAELAYGFAFRDPLWFWLLPLPLLLMLYRYRRRSEVTFGALGLADGDLARRLELPRLPRSLRQRISAAMPFVELVGLSLLVVALARPVERLPLPPSREGSDILLCIDISSSMLATDLATGPRERTRLECVKEAAVEFVQARGSDRIGLVTFARYADLRCPPTLDREAVVELLEAVEPVTAEGPEDATGIGTALSFAAEALARAGTAGKVVVLLTDGEENVATRASPQEIPPLHAAQLARQLGVRAHTIVAGTGKPGPGGATVPLDIGTVQQVAAIARGRFFRARDAAALREIYRDIDAIEKTAFAEPKVLVRELYALWLVFVVGLLAVVGCWMTRRRGVLP